MQIKIRDGVIYKIIIENAFKSWLNWKIWVFLKRQKEYEKSKLFCSFDNHTDIVGVEKGRLESPKAGSTYALICFIYATNMKLIKLSLPCWIWAYIKLESRIWGGWDKCRRLIYNFENRFFGVISLVILKIRQLKQLATNFTVIQDTKFLCCLDF